MNHRLHESTRNGNRGNLISFFSVFSGLSQNLFSGPSVVYAFLLLSLGPAPFAPAQSVTFDFDTGTPALIQRQNLPLSQTAGGITAQFSAVAGSFSIQTDISTGFHLAQFSGKYLYPNNLLGNVLRIQFSRALTEVAFDFATTDYPPTEVPTPILLTAFSVVPGLTNTVGSVTIHAAYGTNTYPMGAFAFNSGDKLFNQVEIRIRPGGGATFFLDTLRAVAVPLPLLNIQAAGVGALVISWPAPAAGFVLQQNPALGAAGWASVTNKVETVDGQNQVTVAPAEGDGFYRLVHP